MLSTERIYGLFFRSARSHSKTARKSSLGPVSFLSMILPWQTYTFLKNGKSGEIENIVLSTERIYGLFFRSARSHSKTARKPSLGLVSFLSMILPWQTYTFPKNGKSGEIENIVLSTERIYGLFFRSARSHSKTARKSSLGPVSFLSMILPWQTHIFKVAVAGQHLLIHIYIHDKKNRQ